MYDCVPNGTKTRRHRSVWQRQSMLNLIKTSCTLYRNTWPDQILLIVLSTSRSAAYNLLCALTCTFNLKIEGQLLETSGLCIPANNTLFIVSISKTLAANEPHLTLEFLEECISGFSKSSKTTTHLAWHLPEVGIWHLTQCKQFAGPGGVNAARQWIHKDSVLLKLTMNFNSIQIKFWISEVSVLDWTHSKYR